LVDPPHLSDWDPQQTSQGLGLMIDAVTPSGRAGVYGRVDTIEDADAPPADACRAVYDCIANAPPEVKETLRGPRASRDPKVIRASSAIPDRRVSRGRGVSPGRR